MIAILQARPTVDLPAHRPAGAFVAAQLQRALASREQVGCPVLGDQAEGVQAHQMRDVAVVRVGGLPILEPFLQVAFLADLDGGQPGAGGFQFGREFIVYF